MLHQAHLYIKGDVVGVGFRAWVKIKTKEAGITGWIRNVYNKPDIFGPSGGIEAVVQGTESAVADMVDHIQEGSPISRVDSVEVTNQLPQEEYKEFVILKSESFSHH